MRVGRAPATVVAAALGLALVLVAGRAAGASVPGEQFRESAARVIRILEDPELQKPGRAADRRAALRQLANQVFDFEEMTKRTLARHWQARTPAERHEFTELFASLLERTYVSKIEQYQGEKFVYTGDSVDGDQATVRTKIVTKNGSEILVDYRMLRRGDRWLVYDVVIEHLSLVVNYRAQFDAIIRRASYAELVGKLRAKDVAAPAEVKVSPSALDSRGAPSRRQPGVQSP